MKHLIQNISLSLLMAGLTFSSCKKERSCESCQTYQPTTNTNKPPLANAGTDTTITLPANTFFLDGSKSFDPDNNIITYQWTKIAGPDSFNIVNANSIIPLVINLVEGIYKFELTVTDSKGAFDKDTITVSVSKIYSNEIIFTNQSWAGCWENICWTGIITNLYNYISTSSSFKVFIKRDNTNSWLETVTYTSQLTGAEYAYEVGNNGDLFVIAFAIVNPGNGIPDIKIIY